MIDFELNPLQKEVQDSIRELAEDLLRPIGRYYDENEHEYIKETPDIVGRSAPIGDKIALKPGQFPPKGFGIGMVIMSEERAFGDVGVALGATRRGLGNAAIGAVATDEQKSRFGDKYAAMAITEPCCGSDTANIRTTAKLDEATNEWILNGEKIFVTGGDHCETVVVWATLDRGLGRAAIKSFVVEKGRPGMTVTKVEDKLGIRASDTAAIVFEDCRIPYDNILGSPEVKERKAGLGGAMKTFDATRPGVAAMAIGVARAALEFTKARLEEEGFSFPYDRGLHELSYVQRTVMEMEANLEVARMLTWKSAAMLEIGARNSLEAAMGKAKAGRAATLITQKCVELLGPLGYSRDCLAEKWMRDCKITDIFEGTGQIQMLIIARNILGFNRDMLK
ncbi:MAG: acyl-CoA dehydrogenase family protein [Proteobacteria bacterium]|nr:acyl-CoA dehydrogenase family protein [Pseudomonadota bacterium]